MQIKNRNLITRFFAATLSFLLWILSFKIIRQMIYKKVENKVDKKIIDVKAKLDK